MTERTWLWLGCAGLLAGMALNLARGDRRTWNEETRTIIHGVVPMIAASAYFAMAVGEGGTTLADGRHFWWARYADWSVTTPLLLLALALSAQHSAVRRPGLILGLLVADVFMIVTALFFGLAVTPWVRWTWFAVSTAAFVAVLWVLWGPLRQEARLEGPAVARSYARGAAFLSALWCAYPLVLLVGADGLRLVGAVWTTALVALLDVTAKTVFGFVRVTEDGRLTARELAARRRPGGPEAARDVEAAGPAAAA